MKNKLISLIWKTNLLNWNQNMRRDYEDGMIDLIFYCIGSNFVDILGIVGKLQAAY